ncbi:UTRA domain-containing protein [Pseudooceanicola marinus]|uniref:UTRA domain-containing protein n=1 Tax=Pseudooceanicola marinus TaxID=396013 RepID=UPI001CD27C91|nr:UTRA domain-containing protein [Pseudooceanicola marinus]MCA1338067.1 UTRA domain-containing protein [Pseudooceanicola marinus]
MAAAQTETLHSRILDEISRKIIDGSWPPGHQLPKETELAAQYGVSRMTMNKVLTQLAQEGYVIRRKRTGTVVAQPRAQAAVLAINNIQDEVAALGRSYRWHLLSADTRPGTAQDQRLLDLDAGEATADTLFLQGLHYSNDDPFCLETRAINLAVVPDAATMDFATEVPGSWLLQTMPWTNARHHVRAVNVSGRDATALNLPVGAACLEILRKTQIEGDWVTYVRLLYPGEAHQLVAEFEGRLGG